MPGLIQAVELLLATHNNATYCPILRGKSLFSEAKFVKVLTILVHRILKIGKFFTLPCPTLVPSAFQFDGTLITEYSGGSRI